MLWCRCMRVSLLFAATNLTEQILQLTSNKYSYGLRLAGKQLAYGKRSGKKVIKKPCGKR